MVTLDSLLSSLLLVAGNGLMTVAGVGIAKFISWLGHKTTNQRSQAILQRLSTLASVVVRDVFQALVDPVKTAGKWNSVVAAEAKAKALVSLRTYLGTKGLEEIVWLIGGDTTVTAIDKLLGSTIEAAVHDLGLEHSIVDAPPPQPPLKPAQSVALPPFLAGPTPVPGV